MSLIDIAVALVLGLLIGYALGARGKGKQRVIAVADATQKEWWKLRDTLSGTQLQILQYMETRKRASIAKLQEKFSFIPDRELFYRLEQIVLMGFIERSRNQDEAVYKLNSDYAGHLEDDKTVILPE